MLKSPFFTTGISDQAGEEKYASYLHLKKLLNFKLFSLSILLIA